MSFLSPRKHLKSTFAFQNQAGAAPVMALTTAVPSGGAVGTAPTDTVARKDMVEGSRRVSFSFGTSYKRNAFVLQKRW